MNNKRRDNIRGIQMQLFALKMELNKIYNQEQDSFDNLPEGLQQTNNGLESEEAIDNLDEAMDHLDEAIGYLEDIL